MNTPGIYLGPDKYLTLREVAAMIDKSTMTVYRYIKAGKLPQPTDAGLFKETEVIEYRTRPRQKPVAD